MHGILGSKKNWRTPGHEFIKRHGQYEAVLVDHRGHGSSPTVSRGTNSVADCADDIVEMFQSELKHVPPPRIIVAHSFSGKVALTYLQKLVASSVNTHRPAHTWILDSLPGPYDRGADAAQQQSVANIIGLLAALPATFASKDWMVKHLAAQGIPLSVALWLCMNVVPAPEGSAAPCRFSFDIATIVSLFADYCRLDLWPFLQTYDGSRGAVHFLRAGKNPAWTPEVLRRFDELTRRNPHVHLHTMPHVGHWLHADDLHGTLDMIDKHSQ